MVDQDELNHVTSYIRGFITGRRAEFDVIDTRILDALRRRPLAEVLSEYQKANIQIGATRGNTPEDVMDLMESIRERRGLSKKEVSERAGISRGHVRALLTKTAHNPTLESLIRLSIALEWPIELVALPTPERSDTSQPHPVEPSLWRSVGVVVGSTMLSLGMIAGIFGIFRSTGTVSKKGKK